MLNKLNRLHDSNEMLSLRMGNISGMLVNTENISSL